MPPPSSRDAVKREFTLLDALILAVAVSVAMAGIIIIFPRGSEQATLLLISRAPVALLLPATLSLIPVRLIPPRPRGKRLWRQPGWVASMSVALALSIYAANRFASMMLSCVYGFRDDAEFGIADLDLDLEWEIFHLFVIFPDFLVFAIAAAWFTLAVSGVWTSEKGWIDWLGRLFGVCWLVHPCCVWGYEFVQAVWWPQSL